MGENEGEFFITVCLMQRIHYGSKPECASNNVESAENTQCRTQQPDASSQSGAASTAPAKYKYMLFSHFDEMHISYSKELPGRDSQSECPQSASPRLEPFEQHKLFLYTRAEEDDMSFLIEGNNQPLLLALVGIKFKRSYFAAAHNKNEYYLLLQNKMNELYQSEEFECLKYMLLHSLGADDLYILIRGNDPVQILKFVHKLRESKFSYMAEDKQTKNEMIILENHTHIGFHMGLDLEERACNFNKLQEVNFKFEMQVRSAIPDTVESIRSQLMQNNFEVYRSGERYDLIAYTHSINIVALIQLYQTNAVINWMLEDYDKYQAISTNGRFLYDYMKSDDQNEKAPIEYNHATKEAKEFFRHLEDVENMNLTKLLCSDLEGKESVDKLMRLYQFGIQRLFYTAYWGEFRDIRYFMLHFLQRLLSYKDLSRDEQEEIKGRVAGSIDVFNENISAVLYDRLLLGIGMRENVRDDVYKTGAYEELIQLYRIWIREIRGIYYCIAKKNVKYKTMFFHALFVPSEAKDILSKELFETCGAMVKESNVNNSERIRNELQKQALVLFQMGTENLWRFNASFICLAHEVGHYLFVYDEMERCKLFVKMLSNYFAYSLEEFLVSIYNPRLPLGLVPELRVQVAQNLINVFDMEKYQGEFASCFRQTRLEFNEMIDYMFEFILTYSSRTHAHADNLLASPKHIPFTSSIVEYLNAYDFYALISDSGFLAVRLKELFADAQQICKSLICETCADFLPHKLLQLTNDNMASSILSEQERLYQQEDPQEIDAYLLALRFLCVYYISDDSDSTGDSLKKWLRTKKSEADFLDNVYTIIESICDNDQCAPAQKWQEMRKLLCEENGYMWESFRNIDFCECTDKVNELRALFKSYGIKEYSLMDLMDFTHAHMPYDPMEDSDECAK